MPQQRKKAGKRTANASQRAARKEENAQRKLAAGYQKALDKADQLMGQMGESSKATVSFDQSLRDTTKSLTELANAVPNEFITQEMIDKAKSRWLTGERERRLSRDVQSPQRRADDPHGRRNPIPSSARVTSRLVKRRWLISTTPTTVT